MSKLVPFTYALAIYRHSRTPLKVLKQFQLSSNKLFRKKLLRNLQNLLVVPYKPFNSCSFQGPAKYEDFNSSFNKKIPWYNNHTKATVKRVYTV